MNETTNLYNSGFTQRLYSEHDYASTLESGGKRRCMGCMETYDAQFDLCPYCGFTVTAEVDNSTYLFPGTVLDGKYLVGRVIRSSDLGITYVAWDSVLHRKVIIKEFLPRLFATRSTGCAPVIVFSGERCEEFIYGMQVFISQAIQLSKFRNLNGIVKIFDVIEANGTAYIVREYLEGETLEDYLKKNGTVSFHKALDILTPLFKTLDKIHGLDIVHMNIEPGNIFFTQIGEVKLLDFGAARNSMVSYCRIVSSDEERCFLPEELSGNGNNYGAYTDVYSVAALIYRMVTGINPATALERRTSFEKSGKDCLEPIEKIAKDITRNQAVALKNALNIRSADRTPDIRTFVSEIFNEEKNIRRKNGIKKSDKFKWPLGVKIAVAVILTAVTSAGIFVARDVLKTYQMESAEFVLPYGDVIVPDIVTMDIHKAESFLKEKNLQVVISDMVETGFVGKDAVMKQYPDAGTVLNYGEAIHIKVSYGYGKDTVDNVKGFSVEQAQKLLEDKGFKVTTEETKSSEYARNVVVSQSVAAGTELEQGSEIKLTVSRGNESIVTSKRMKTPKITGKDYEKTRKQLKSDGLFVAIVKYSYNPDLPDGQIVKQTPSSGEEVNAGSVITVTVNRAEDVVRVPNVRYLKEENAKKILEDKGFIVEIKFRENEITEKGTVVEQNIPVGTTVDKGTKIVLTLSSGFTVEVPDVCGLRLDQAQKILLDAGLAFDTVSQANKKYTVINQSIVSGNKAEKGTVIKLVIAESN